jgi:hypothetical protein
VRGGRPGVEPIKTFLFVTDVAAEQACVLVSAKFISGQTLCRREWQEPTRVERLTVAKSMTRLITLHENIGKSCLETP